MLFRMHREIQFRRRLGSVQSGAPCVGCDGCPDIWELESGDFAVIGVDITAAAKAAMPASAGCANDERVVLVPREVLVNAKHDIPNHV